MRNILIFAALALPLPLQAANHIVNVGGANTVYSPQFLVINPGDTVTWLNKGGKHNVEADDGSFSCARGCTGDGKGGSGAPSASNWIATRTFDQPGVTIGYFCVLHGAPGTGMYGTIIVSTMAVHLLSFEVD